MYSESVNSNNLLSYIKESPSGSTLKRILIQNDSFKIHMKGLKKKTSPSDVFVAFSQFGIVSKMKVPYSKSKEKNMGYGFIEFKNDQDAISLLMNNSSILIDGKDVLISQFKSKNNLASINYNISDEHYCAGGYNHIDENLIKYERYQAFQTSVQKKIDLKTHSKESLRPEKNFFGDNLVPESQSFPQIQFNKITVQKKKKEYVISSDGDSFCEYTKRIEHSVRPTSVYYFQNTREFDHKSSNYRLNKRSRKIGFHSSRLSKIGVLARNRSFNSFHPTHNNWTDPLNSLLKK